MTEGTRKTAGIIDADLLVTHLEYAAWATKRTLDMVDKLPSGAVTQPVESSFPTLLATLQHVYGWDKYYFVHMKGEHVDREAVKEPQTYDELRREWPKLHSEIVSWGRQHLPKRQDIVLKGWGVWPTWMIVMHMANHATHHFGQVVTLLRQLGYTPEPMEFTDLIMYYLRRYPQEGQKESIKPLLE